MPRRDQDRPRSGLFGDREIVLGEAEQIIGAGRAASTQLVGLGRIDADRQSPRLQFSHRLLEMGEGRVRQATEIDHVGAVGAQGFGARRIASMLICEASTISAKIRNE